MSDLQVVKGWLDSIDAREDDFARWLAPDVAWWAPGGAAQGAEEVAGFVRGFMDAFPDLVHVIQRSTVMGTVVITEIVTSGTNTGPIASAVGLLPPTGRTMSLHSVGLYDVQGGVIVEGRLYFDQVEITSQLDLGPEVILSSYQ
ncbi:MAG: hypothetical protein GEU71_02915 [Actinobacteria bacterium]|nr:hypothetical protein [Actinomycetota bacterium]